MSDDSEKPSKRSLSEISHLFLSSVRNRQTQGAERPQRMPPHRSDVTIDLTPEEFAEVYGGAGPAIGPQRRTVPIAAVIGAHLNGKQFDRVKDYARHLAGRVGRVGLIELDASEFRLMCFDAGAPHGPSETQDHPPECGEARQMTEALEEMNWDVEQWLLLLPNPRTPEARALLRELDHWVLLSTCDHDGVVSSYRMLKGIAEEYRPKLTLSLLGSPDAAECERVFAKLSGVCRQFLDWPLEAGPAVEPAPAVKEHLASLYRPSRDKAQLANGAQWVVVGEFLAAARIARENAMQSTAESAHDAAADEQPIHETIIPLQATSSAPPAGPRPAEPLDSTFPMPRPFAAPAPGRTLVSADDSFDEVIDLPGQDVSGQSIIAAILRKACGGLIECPLRPPMCPEARLAVGRDHEIVLLAVARQGLGELRAIGQAYRWLSENRELIGMALPQFNIHRHQPPKLKLLVDRADMTADLLDPLLHSDHVTVQAYRKLRWGDRLGVSLEAA